MKTGRERDAIISGIGMSTIGRHLHRSKIDLTMEACYAAIADAGLEPKDIDGLATYPGGIPGSPGYPGPGAQEVQDAMRLRLNWCSGSSEGPAQLQAVVNAVMAVSMGLARHVVVFRTVTEASAQGSGGRRPAALSGKEDDLPGWRAWTVPFGAFNVMCHTAMIATRHFALYGTTREQMAQITLNDRRNAMLNERAILRSPLTMDDYFDARIIAAPLCLFDCDLPCDGSVAFVVSHRDVANDLRTTPVQVNAMGTALWGRPSWDQYEDLSSMPATEAAASMWARTDLRPEDVDIAELYDGFSIHTMIWLEALGFCTKGESGAFVEGGERIAREGQLPLNTHGGQLSGGRLHGFSFVHEAVLQLRGEAGAHQVPKQPEVAVAANGGGPIEGCLLLTRGLT